MDQSEADIALVEKYFDNEMTESEQTGLEVRLKTDSNFRLLFEQERTLISAIRHQGLREDLQFLRTVEERLEDPKLIPIRSSRRLYYAAAACVAAILVVIAVLQTSRTTHDELFIANFQPYPNVFEPTVRSNGSATDRSDAFKAYEHGDYKEATRLFGLLLSEKTESSILLLNGNAWLQLGKVEEAKKNFNALSADFDDLDTQAKWFLSLCYIRTGDTAKAKSLLEELEREEGSYAEKATKLLEELK